jgi:curli biogenesis system outer membrane secretion channel CsgG
MTSVSRRAAVWLLLSLAGCAPSASVTKGGGASIDEARAEAYNGPKARITVGGIIDKSGDGKTSIRHQIGVLAKHGKTTDARAITGGIRDMITTALFQSNRYIVLERDAIGEVLMEQEFSATGKVGEATKIPTGEIEGAELLVVGAVTGFDPAVAGGVGFPLPLPINRGRDVLILDLEFRKAFVSMDLRVIDVRTGRIVSTVAVEGAARKFGAGVSGIARTRYGGGVRIPTVLRGFANTPIESAISEMVDEAVSHIVENTPQNYFHYPAAPAS